VTLINGHGDILRIKLVADLPDYAPNPLPFFADNVRNSNPFGLAIDADQLYVVNAGLNAVVKVDIDTGSFETLTTFAPLPNPLPFGPPLMDAVPDSIHLVGGQLLVTLLPGFPFPIGGGMVQEVDPGTGNAAPFITGLTMAIDVIPGKTRARKTPLFVLEFSINPDDFDAPGRLSRYDSPAGPPVVIADNLITPGGMAFDPVSGSVFITEVFTGNIIR